MLTVFISGYLFCSAQAMWEITFDHGSGADRIILPEGNSSLWQIGKPSKKVFTGANSSPCVIVTDTLNPYPVNDTSSFVVVHIANDGWKFNYPKIDVGGWYYVNSDTLSDYGFIEFSPDKGKTWTLVDSTNSGCCSWGASQEYPVFTGNSNGWKHFYYCLCTSVPVNIGDTILYRFTFISDGNQTYKDGLMFDNLHFEDWAEGIDERLNNSLISLSPNPVSEILRIQTTRAHGNKEIQIYNITGQKVYENLNFDSEFFDTGKLIDGLYIIKFTVDQEYTVKKFIVKH